MTEKQEAFRACLAQAYTSSSLYPPHPDFISSLHPPALHRLLLMNQYYTTIHRLRTDRHLTGSTLVQSLSIPSLPTHQPNTLPPPLPLLLLHSLPFPLTSQYCITTHRLGSDRHLTGSTPRCKHSKREGPHLHGRVLPHFKQFRDCLIKIQTYVDYNLQYPYPSQLGNVPCTLAFHTPFRKRFGNNPLPNLCFHNCKAV